MKVKKIHKKIILTLLFLCIICSCNNKNADGIGPESIAIDAVKIFREKNKNSPEMIFPMEYYQEKIIEFQKIIPIRCKINVIHKIDSIIPGLLCFVVGWDDFNAGRGEGFDIIANAPPRGNFFGLYTFDTDQKIIKEYQVGFKNYLDVIRNSVMEKIPGNKLEYGAISCGDFNNDGINEIVSIYLHPPHYDYVFAVFGYNAIENDFTQTLLVPIYIHFDQPFPSVEYTGNGFRILEVLENKPLELAWNNYVWDNHTCRYKKLKY